MRLPATTMLATTAMTLGLGAAPAMAHVGTGGAELRAGSTTTVELTVPHGCDDLATTALEVLVPAQLKLLGAVAPEGFAATITGDVVRFEGGSLPSHETGIFTLEVEVADVAGRAHLRSVQECGDVELPWLDIGGDGVAEGQPAPSVLVVGAGAALAEPTLIASGQQDQPAIGLASTFVSGVPDGVVAAIAAMALIIVGAATRVALRRRSEGHLD